MVQKDNTEIYCLASCLIYNLECNHYILHLFLYGITPENVSVLLVNGISFNDHLLQLTHKFMCSFRYQALSNLAYNFGPFLRTWLTDQLKIVFMLDALNYDIFGNLIGCDPLRFDNFSHNVDLSFHLQQLSQPAVDFLRVSHYLTTTFWSSTLRAEPFFSMINECFQK